MMVELPEAHRQTGASPSHEECSGAESTEEVWDFEARLDNRRTCAVLSLGVCAFAIIAFFGERLGAFIGAHSFRGDSTDIELAGTADTAADAPNIDTELMTFLSESSFGRQIVIDLMLKEYANPDLSHGSSPSNYTLEDAIAAIQSSERVGEPVQVKGHPFLYIGSVGESSMLYLTIIDFIVQSS